MGKSEGKVLDAVATRQTKARKEIIVADGGVSLKINFANGESELINLPANLREEFAGYGLRAVVDEVLAKTKTVEDALQAVREVAVRIESGNFERRERKGSGGKANAVVQAIAAVNGVSLEKAAAWYVGQDRAGKAAARADSRVKAHLANAQTTSHDFTGLAD